MTPSVIIDLVTMKLLQIDYDKIGRRISLAGRCCLYIYIYQQGMFK
jgi:hypothetical protein